MKASKKVAICVFLIVLSTLANVYAAFQMAWNTRVTVRVDPLTPRSADLSVSCIPSAIAVGNTATIYGKLINATSKEGIYGQTISLYSRPGVNPSWTYLTSVITIHDGTYSFIWTDASTLPSGFYAVNATFLGNVDYDLWTSVTDFQVTAEETPNDIALVDFSPVQVVYGGSALVANKPTQFRAIVKNSFSETQILQIRFVFDSGSSTDYLTTIEANSVKEVFIPFSSFILSQEGTMTYSVEIDPDDEISETNEGNNFKSGSREVRNASSLVIHYYKLQPILPVYGTPSWNDFLDTVNEGNSFVDATYPVAGSEFSGVSVGTLWSDPIPWLGIVDDILSLSIYAGIGGFDRAVGIVSDDYFPFHHVPDASTTTGWANPGAPQAALVRAGFWTTVAHEIGHTYGLNRNGEDYDINPPGSFASGYWVTKGKEIPKAISFMGVSTFRSFEYNSTHSVWVADSHYESLLDVFAPSTARFASNLIEPSTSTLFVRGIAFENGTMEFRDMYLLDGGAVKYPEPGNWSLVFRNSSGQVLSETPFNVSFAMFGGKTLSNVTGFAFSVPYPAASTTIQVWRNLTLILEKQVTSYAPSIEVLSPNGGEFLIAGPNCTVTWNASDLDGDPLASTIAYSSDAGENWIPVATDVEGNTYVWNVSSVEDGSDYLVRVIATDGVNTGEDVSDNVFTVSKIHDLAVTDVTLSKVFVGQNYSMSINVTVQNNGECIENFNVTAYANTTTITTLTNATLANGNSTSLTLTWNTTSFEKGNYTISAQATPVPYERNIEDNTFTDGTVLVTIAGDINGDSIVDIYDLNAGGRAYGSYAGDPRYNPDADFNNDGHVDMRDIIVIGRNYGKAVP